jgi:hypothetical protein
MAVKHYTYSLTTAPVALTDVKASDRHRGLTIIFNTDKENNAVTLIGGIGLTDTSWGVHLDADESFTIAGEYRASDVFYARAKTGTATLHVLLVGA